MLDAKVQLLAEARSASAGHTAMPWNNELRIRCSYTMWQCQMMVRYLISWADLVHESQGTAN